MSDVYRMMIGQSRGYYAYKDIPYYASPDGVFSWNMTCSDVRITEPISSFFEWYLGISDYQVAELYFNDRIKVWPRDHRGLMLTEIRL